uniref:SERPIN domain-containing protein n=1 Tax=Panagrellus redivivus TaxID=6233 RepID=A0A7E4ZZN5_PANRE
MRVHMSELAVCSVIAIEKQCGRQAADFYAYMQTAIIGEEFPIQCKYDYDNDELRELLTDSRELPTLPNASAHFMVQDLLLPASKTLPSRPDSSENTSADDSPHLKKTKLVSSPGLAKKTLQLFLAEQQGLPFSDSGENSKPQIIRNRNFGRIFRPPKFAEVNVRKPATNEHTVIVQLLSPEENLHTHNKTLFEANDELPGFLQGARPIPDSSFVRRPIISPKSQVMNRLAPYAEHYADAAKKDLTPARENYTPQVGSTIKAVTTTKHSNVTSTTTTTTPTSVPSTSTMTSSVKTTPTTAKTSAKTTTSPSTTTSSTTTTTSTSTTTPLSTTTTPVTPKLSFKISPTIVTTDPEMAFFTSKPASPALKFLPWYYSTFATKRIDPMVTAHPYQPMSNSMFTTTEGPYIYYNVPAAPRLPVNFDPQKFAKNFVSSISTTQLPVVITNGPSKLSHELSNFLDIDHIKQKADSLLTSAIDVLKPENSTNQNNNLNGHRLNRPANDALNGLIKTIEELSPSVINNLRQKLDNLGHN